VITQIIDGAKEVFVARAEDPTDYASMVVRHVTG